MTDAANSKVEDHRYRRASSAYSGLEPAICELAHISAITRFYVSECSDHVADADRIITAVSHVADLTEALREAYLANFPGDKSDTGIVGAR
jgi:hypothetical protein